MNQFKGKKELGVSVSVSRPAPRLSSALPPPGHRALRLNGIRNSLLSETRFLVEFDLYGEGFPCETEGSFALCLCLAPKRERIDLNPAKAAMSPPKARKGRYHGHEAVFLENDLIRVVVLPRFRARVIEYVLKSSGRNQLYSKLDDGYGQTNAGSKPIVKAGTEAALDEYSLEWDVTFDWPKAVYKLGRTAERAFVRIALRQHGLQLQVVYAIEAASTRLAIQYKLTNRSRKPTINQLNFHTLWAVGGRPHPGSILSAGMPPNAVSRVYFPDMPFSHWHRSSASHAAVSSPAARESVLLAVDENVGAYFLLGNAQACNLEAYSKPAKLAPGQSTSLSVGARILQAAALDRGFEGAAFGCTPEKRFLVQPRRIRVVASAASWAEALEGTVSVTLAESGRAEPLAHARSDFRVSPLAGAQRNWLWEAAFPTRNLRDGRYLVKITTRIGGKTRTQRFPIRLLGSWARRAAVELNAAKKALLGHARKQNATEKTVPLAGALFRLQQATRLLSSVRKSEIDDARLIARLDGQIRELQARLSALDGVPPPPHSRFKAMRKCLKRTETYYYSCCYDSFSEDVRTFFGGLPTLAVGEDKILSGGQTAPVEVRGIRKLLGFDFARASTLAAGVSRREAESVAERLGARAAKSTRERRSSFTLYVASPSASLPPEAARLVPASRTRPFAVFGKGPKGHVGVVGGATAAERACAAEFAARIVRVLKGRQLLAGDLHTHTTLSDGRCAPAEILVAALQGRLDFIAVTDHNCVEGSLAARKAARALRLNLPVIPGQETQLFAARSTHIVVLGLTEMMPPTISLAELFKRVRRKGGLTILGHPLRGVNGGEGYEFQKRLLARFSTLGFDALEAVEGAFESAYAGWEKRNRVPNVVATSDNHAGSFFVPIRTILFADDKKVPSLLEAIRDGRSLGLRHGRLYGSKPLREVFLALLEEREYLEHTARVKLAATAKLLKRILPRIVGKTT